MSYYLLVITNSELKLIIGISKIKSSIIIYI